MQVEQASACADGRAEKKRQQDEQFRFHVIKRSRFIFRQNQQP